MGLYTIAKGCSGRKRADAGRDSCLAAGKRVTLVGLPCARMIRFGGKPVDFRTISEPGLSIQATPVTAESQRNPLVTENGAGVLDVRLEIARNGSHPPNKGTPQGDPHRCRKHVPSKPHQWPARQHAHRPMPLPPTQEMVWSTSSESVARQLRLQKPPVYSKWVHRYPRHLSTRLSLGAHFMIPSEGLGVQNGSSLNFIVPLSRQRPKLPWLE